MTTTDEAGIIAHARALASELGPGDPAATLLALCEQNARLLTENRFLHHRRGVLVLQRDTERALALRLRDAWRAAAAPARDHAAWIARLEAERDAKRAMR